jgi:hypothetical protein
MAEARARKGRATYEEGQQALAEVEYLPAMPSVAAKTPELKPEGGGFKANMLSPDAIDRKQDRWVAVKKALGN